MGNDKKDCFKELSIDEEKFKEKFKEQDFKEGKHEYLNKIISEITKAMSESCNPFVIFNIILSFIETKFKHANTVIIHYSKDYSNILMIYYEPHGSISKFVHSRITIHEILDYIKTNIIINGKKAKVEILWGVK
jgi:hypothetical protein